MSPIALVRHACVALAFVAIAEARPAASPPTQALACPSDAEECELAITGTLTYSKREVKWDALRIWAIVDGKRMAVHASINIPHRDRLRLKTRTRYTFTIAARKPFGAREVWVIDAKR